MVLKGLAGVCLVEVSQAPVDLLLAVAKVLASGSQRTLVGGRPWYHICVRLPAVSSCPQRSGGEDGEEGWFGLAFG